MIIIVYGTTGELIKLTPFIKALKREDHLTICTYQQPQQLKKLFKEAKIEQPNIKIGQNETAKDLENLISVPVWFLKVWWGFFKNSKSIKQALNKSATQQNLLLVHGDTTTTLLGTFMGKLLRIPVAHVEAGLRSYSWRHPFPEELNRVITSKIARLHFAPGKTPTENLRRAKTKGKIIDTKYNTVLDSLRLARKEQDKENRNLPSKYCLVSIHRNELMAQPKELKALLDDIQLFAESIPILFLDHPITKERIRSLNYNEMLKHKNITRLSKQSYFSFIRLLTQADCVITDSGGLQEETAYLGIPCLVHRKATERKEGLGQNVILSYYDPNIVREFFVNFERLKSTGVTETTSPTNIILGVLQKEGYIQR